MDALENPKERQRDEQRRKLGKRDRLVEARRVERNAQRRLTARARASLAFAYASGLSLPYGSRRPTSGGYHKARHVAACRAFRVQSGKHTARCARTRHRPTSRGCGSSWLFTCAANALWLGVRRSCGQCREKRISRRRPLRGRFRCRRFSARTQSP